MFHFYLIGKTKQNVIFTLLLYLVLLKHFLSVFDFYLDKNKFLMRNKKKDLIKNIIKNV